MSKNKDFFWMSFTDLMTSLFFVMLVLFILALSIMNYKNSVLKVKLEEFQKIEEIKKAINNIDDKYFIYDEKYKKHILNIETHFENASDDIRDIPYETRVDLVKAGKKIDKLINNLPKGNNVSYLIVVEGQASKDNWHGNNELSYRRALALKQFWINNNLDFSKKENCEYVIAGSGQQGVPRILPDVPPNNQRFLITIIPKVGLIH